MDKYEGKFKNGLPHGSGKYTWSNGDNYDGQFKKGKNMVKEVCMISLRTKK
ncbi:MAG: hypothetical protein ACP5DQ_11160 [Bacteroidales bacterium]